MYRKCDGKNCNKSAVEPIYYGSNYLGQLCRTCMIRANKLLNFVYQNEKPEKPIHIYSLKDLEERADRLKAEKLSDAVHKGLNEFWGVVSRELGLKHGDIDPESVLEFENQATKAVRRYYEHNCD